MNIRQYGLALVVALFATGVVAGTNGYQCVVSTEAELQGDGALGKPRKISALGKKFAVDRRNGALVEPDGEYWSFGGSSAVVLSKGNSENSFVSVTTSPARETGVHATFVRVQEYEQGKLKPFIVVTGGVVYTGVCE